MPNDITVVKRHLDSVSPRLTDVLAGRMPVAQLIQTVLQSFERNDKLYDCLPQSVLNAAMTFAVLGLPVDGVTGQGFMVPFKGRAQPIVGYKGYNTLAARAGVTIQAGTVFESDHFEFQLGTNPNLVHKPAHVRGERIICFWAVATSRERPPIVEVMSLADIIAVKEKSPAVKGGAETPWNDPIIGFVAMGQKTVRRRLARSMPLALNHPEFHLAARLDQAHEEQGEAAYLLPGGRLMVDDQIMPIRNTEEPTATELIRNIDDVANTLREAAKAGPEALQLQWRSLSGREQRELTWLKDELKKAMGMESGNAQT